MIDPRQALEEVRSQLRREVLPRLDRPEDDYARSVLVAALGILRELRAQVRPDEDWCRASVAELAPAAEDWERRLDDDQTAERVRELRRAAADADSPAAARQALLAAAEEALRAAWAQTADDPRGLRADVRARLAADLERQIEAGGRPSQG